MNKLRKYRLAGEIESTASGKLIYLLLMDIVDADGKVTISHRRLSEALGLSRNTISRNLRRLYASGYIDIIPQYHDDNDRAANRYYTWRDKYEQ